MSTRLISQKIKKAYNYKVFHKKAPVITIFTVGINLSQIGEPSLVVSEPSTWISFPLELNFNAPTVRSFVGP